MTETLEETTLRPIPTVVVPIVGMVKAVLASDLDTKEPEALYLTTREILEQSGLLDDPTKKADTIFSYYLEAYRVLKVSQQDGPETDDQRHYVDASLALMTLYQTRSFDAISRRLTVLAARSLSAVITAVHSLDETEDFKQALTAVGNVAFLAETLPRYLKGTRRRRNMAYVNWLQTLFTTALTTDDLYTLMTSPTVTAVITRIQSTSEIRVIPESFLTDPVS